MHVVTRVENTGATSDLLPIPMKSLLWNTKKRARMGGGGGGLKVGV